MSIKKISDGAYEKTVTREEKVYIDKNALLREKENLQQRLKEIDADLAAISSIDKDAEK